MNETKMGLLRIAPPTDVSGWPHFTAGKVYPVVEFVVDTGRDIFTVISDNGGRFQVGEAAAERFWKLCWLLPDGSTVEVLE